MCPGRKHFDSNSCIAARNRPTLKAITRWARLRPISVGVPDCSAAVVQDKVAVARQRAGLLAGSLGLYVAKIAAAVGRPDLSEFFSAEHRKIGRIVNERLWDAKHGIYNDRCDPEDTIQKYSDPKKAGEFVTEIEPGVIDKPVDILLPLFLARSYPNNESGR
jgi:hypothetical protein